MTATRKYTYWVWFDDDTLSPVYVGWGPYVNQGRFGLKHPSSVLWGKRFDFDSELNDWLRNYEINEPTHCETFTLKLQFFHKVDARTIAVNTRRKLVKEGFALLNPKPFDKLTGGGRRRPVKSPDGTIYRSVREAAKTLSVDPGSIVLWCRATKNGWTYFDPLE